MTLPTLLAHVAARWAVTRTPAHGWVPDESEIEMTEHTYTLADMARAWDNGHSWGWEDARTKAYAERGADIGPRTDWRLRTANPHEQEEA